MNILIAYVGQSGTTERCAGILAQKLKNVTIVNLFQEFPNVTKYDCVIIGSNVKFGRLHKKARSFISKYKNELLNRNVAYYLCCGFAENYQKYFEESISKDLLNKAVIYDTFGGEINDKSKNIIDKFMLNIVNNATKDREQPRLLTENIDNFAIKISCI